MRWIHALNVGVVSLWCLAGQVAAYTEAVPMCALDDGGRALPTGDFGRGFTLWLTGGTPTKDAIFVFPNGSVVFRANDLRDRSNLRLREILSTAVKSRFQYSADEIQGIMTAFSSAGPAQRVRLSQDVLGCLRSWPG